MEKYYATFRKSKSQSMIILWASVCRCLDKCVSLQKWKLRFAEMKIAFTFILSCFKSMKKAFSDVSLFKTNKIAPIMLFESDSITNSFSLSSSSLSFSVTRIEKISPLKQNFKSIQQFFWGLFSIWKNLEPIFSNYLCYWRKLHCFEWPKLNT